MPVKIAGMMEYIMSMFHEGSTVCKPCQSIRVSKALDLTIVFL